MNDNQLLISSYINLYKKLFPSGKHISWAIFWKRMYQNSVSDVGNSPSEIRHHYAQALSQALGSLAQSDPLVKKFLSTLPLRYSKTVLSWPPLPEELEELMTD